ncbi:MAG: hypothetical protein ACI94D_002673, partial [Neolewinella sp.]
GTGKEKWANLYEVYDDLYGCLLHMQ